MKKCSECRTIFVKPKKDLEKLRKKKGKSNITKQKRLMEARADILQCAHACDVVILMHHKHGLGETVTCYGTEGAGVSFIGNKMDVKRSEGGEMALMLFKKFMQDFKSNSSSQQQNGSSTKSVSNKRAKSTTVQPPFSIQQEPSDSSLCSATISGENASSAKSDSCGNTNPAVVTTSSTSAQDYVPPSIANENEMIVYKISGVLAACGYLRENQKVLHCHDVPTDHVCVLVTTTKEGERVDAPLVLGDPDENSFLEKGRIFAVPKKFLHRPSFGPNNSIDLAPYINS